MSEDVARTSGFLTEEELSAEQGSELPAREALSLIDTASAGGPLPLDGSGATAPTGTEGAPATAPTTSTNPLEGTGLSDKLMSNPFVG